LKDTFSFFLVALSMPPKRIKTVDQDDNTTNKKQKTDSSSSLVVSSSSISISLNDEKQVCWYDGNCKQKNPAHWAAYKHEKQTEYIKSPEEKKASIVPVITKTAIGYASSSSSEDDFIVTKKSKPTPKAVPIKSKAVAKPKAATKKKIISDDEDDDDDDYSDDPPKKVIPKAATKATVPTKPTTTTTTTTTTSKPQISKKLSSLTGNDPSHNAQNSQREGLVNYKNMMRYCLSGFEITSDKKKLLLEIRKKEEITKEEHEQSLGMFGWTTEEYEVGEREPDHDYDLKEELDVYKQENGFKILTLTHDQKLTKEQEAVWAKASAKFFQTMAKAQGNYTIKSLGIIMNTKLNKGFIEQKKSYEERKKNLGAITWGFHGSTPESIRSISKEGFKLPDELKKKKGKSKVELLDDGYFGNGIYFSVYSDYAMWYSEERESDEILLSALLQGETYQCTGRSDGEGLQKGFDSHISPKGNEIIVFNQSQILPRFIIKFEENEGQEREQED
jgi:hypothetical protein